MSFFERAKAAANDLAAKADVAMNQAGINTPGAAGGGGDRTLRDLGFLAYLEATGRAADPAARERLLATLRELESSGRLGPLTVTPPPGYAGDAPSAPPPPPGYAGDAPSAPPPPPGYAGNAPGAPAAPPPPAGPEPTPPGSTPPPPPPSWA